MSHMCKCLGARVAGAFAFPASLCLLRKQKNISMRKKCIFMSISDSSCDTKIVQLIAVGVDTILIFHHKGARVRPHNCQRQTDRRGISQEVIPLATMRLLSSLLGEGGRIDAILSDYFGGTESLLVCVHCIADYVYSFTITYHWVGWDWSSRSV